MGNNILRILKEPVHLAKRAIKKLVIHPLKYRNGEDYKAEQYWKDRFEKHGNSLKAVGHEGWTVEDNEKDYQKGASDVMNTMEEEGLMNESHQLLEIGLGVGYYTRKFMDNGIKNLTALDITDHYFKTLRAELPGYKFVKKDISSENLDGQYDFIIMIDVIQHIVSEDKFKFAMRNIADHLKTGGKFILSGVGYNAGKQLFYVRSWTEKEVSAALPSLSLKKDLPFRGLRLLVYTKNSG